MPEVVQEYVHSGGQRVGCDPTTGVIRGVKLLGLESKNGRSYPEPTLRRAISLYEGAKVNVNHPQGDPLSTRDYRDRLGLIRNVCLKTTEGLFGDLHFNPKHALAEQIAWDAEHSPENLGLSHNVLAQTSRRGDQLIVEAITRVQSVDLVADPATTSGLYESVEPSEPDTAEPVTTDDPIEEAVVNEEAKNLLIERVLQEQEVDPDEAFLSETFLQILNQLDEELIAAAISDRQRYGQQVLNEARSRVPHSREGSLPTKESAVGTTSDFVSAITS